MTLKLTEFTAKNYLTGVYIQEATTSELSSKEAHRQLQFGKQRLIYDGATGDTLQMNCSPRSHYELITGAINIIVRCCEVYY